jgi:hypothetical protein
MAEALKDDLSQLIGEYEDYRLIGPEFFVRAVVNISKDYFEKFSKIP